jgi:hypothetical protein
MKLTEIKTNSALQTADDMTASLEIRETCHSKSSKPLPKSQHPSLPISKRPESGKFNRSKREDLFRISQTPGPGDYEISPITSGPRFSIIGKSKEQRRVSPGPGSYTPDPLSKRVKGSRIGKSLRSDFIDLSNNTPGPGRYNSSTRQSTPSWTFQKTHEFAYNCVTPGPGNYEGKSLSKGAHHSITSAKRKEIFYLNETPGPGAYDSASFNTVRYSIGKGKRMDEGIAKKLASKTQRVKKRQEVAEMNGNSVRSQIIKADCEGLGNGERKLEKVGFVKGGRVYLTIGKFETRGNCLAPDIVE